jgi:aspartyl protease family protein
MVFAIPLALLGATLVALLVVPEGTPLIGLDHASFARAAFAVVFLVWLALDGARRAGAAGLARVLGGAAAWAAIILGLTGAYAYRFEAAEFAQRLMGELFPGEPQIGASGEVIVNRRLSGEFVVPATIADTRIAMLFDTGATTVVLRAEDAAKVGLDTRKLDFDVDVVTANGSASAAEVVLDRIAVGPIVARNVAALVAHKGALGQSLLGMSFLERLQSYSVERGRLVLKGK